MGFKTGGKVYYYVYNLQGDVTHIVDESKNIVATYRYDPFGKILNLSSLTSIGKLNPFRYRGYYYDTESNLYYLNSRYYNPEIGRFINADAILGANKDVLGYNLYAYCSNNPICNIDPFGFGLEKVFGIIDEIMELESITEAVDKYNNGNKNHVAEAIDKKNPPNHPDFKPPKKGGNQRVRNPNGQNKGWLSKDGGVWVPDDDMDGGEGWVVQYPNGEHWHAYPGGHVRKHIKYEPPTDDAVIMIFAGAVVTAGLLLDNTTGVGFADDVFIPASTGCFITGINGLVGRYVCSDCGEVVHGY